MSATVENEAGAPASVEGTGVFASVTSGRRSPRSLAWLALVLAAACGEDPPPSVMLEDGAVELGAAASVHEVTIERRGGRETLTPSDLAVRQGDVIRFTSRTLDSHAFAFRMARLTPEQQAFLVETGQDASAPIVESGHAWVISLEGAPAGAYPVICLIHESEALIRVREEA